VLSHRRKRPIYCLFDNDDATLAALLPFAKRVAKAIEAVVPCKRCFVTAIGLEVPHTHLHIIPANNMSDYSFKNKVEMSSEALAELAKAIGGKFV
jgi:histidine triad (HIT) family protein